MVKEEGDQEIESRGPRRRPRRGAGAEVVHNETSDDGEEAPEEDAEEQQEGVGVEEENLANQDAFYNEDEVVGLEGVFAHDDAEEEDLLFREDVHGESLGKRVRLPHLKF